MPNMHAMATWSPHRIQIKRLPLLIPVKYEIQLPMAEHDPSPQEPVWFVTGDLLELYKQIGRYGRCAELYNQLVVVYWEVFPMVVGSAGDFEGCDSLLDCSCCLGWGFFGRW